MRARLDRFGEHLVARQMITREELARLLSIQKAIPEKIGQLAVREGLISEDKCMVALSEFIGIPLADGTEGSPDADIARMIPEKMARLAGVAPLGRRDNGVLMLACNGPVAQSIMQNLSRLARCRVKLVLVPERQLKKLQQAVYARDVSTRIDWGARQADGDSLGFIVEMLEKIIVRAVTAGNVSDIHFEPEVDEFLVRFREDGMLRRSESLPLSMARNVISRIKVLANLDIAERRTPQDGAFAFTPSKLDVQIDAVNMRVSILPVIRGEKAVLRILPPHDEPVPLDSIGMDEVMVKQFRNQLMSPHGLILVTGPTGSGKTTTLYGCLQLVRSETTNVTTLEEPVEQTLGGINQTQIEGSEKISFASALRAILRQDPDIIMVGEIRDADTLQVSLRAAITGHLVLSTLHTNDAPSAFTRLMDMGGEPFLLAVSVRAVLAQRLVRLSCPHCRRPEPVTLSELQMLGLDHEQEGAFTVQRGAGCDLCRRKGYLGRTGIFELLQVDEDLRSLIGRRSEPRELIERARANGIYRSLLEDGIDKVKQGLTTPEEIRRVTMI